MYVAVGPVGSSAMAPCDSDSARHAFPDYRLALHRLPIFRGERVALSLNVACFAGDLLVCLSIQSTEYRSLFHWGFRHGACPSGAWFHAD